MNTIKIFLAPSGATASIYKDFPLYQGSFQNKLLNVYVPTSILSPKFKTYNANSGAEEDPFVAGTAVKVAMETIARNGKFAYSKDYYVRYLKTLTKDGVEYALFERKLPQEFTFYAGQGANAPALILNVVNMAFAVESAKIKNYELPGGNCSITAFSEEAFISKIGKPTASRSYIFENVHQTSYASGSYYYESTLEGKTVSPIDYGITLQGALPASTPGYIDIGVTVTGEILSVTTSQRVKLDVLPSSNLDKEESVEPSEWEAVEARLNALTAALPAKQDKEDNALTTPQKTVVGAINNLDGRVKSNSQSITAESLRIDKAQQDIIALQKRPAGTNYIGMLTVAENLPTDEQLLAFVKSVKGESYELQNGDAVTVVVTKAAATDEVYFYKWNGEAWSYYALPPVEPASNDNLGLVKGDTSFTHGNVSVTIVNGIITAIKVLSNGQPIEVNAYLNDLDTLLQKIVTGEQTVGKAERALKDGLGQTISDTYLDKMVGASKNYVQDYALPKKFNENLYLQKSGSGFIYAPTIVDEEVTTVDTGAAFGYTTIYTADYALVDTKFNLNAKNSINIVNTLSLDVATQTAFIARAYVIGADGTETLLAAKQSSFETIPANTTKEIAFSMAFIELGKREITVASGDKIRIQFVVFKTAPTAANISLVSGGTSSSINLFVDSQTIAVIGGNLDENSIVQETGTAEDKVMSQKASTDNFVKILPKADDVWRVYCIGSKKIPRSSLDVTDSGTWSSSIPCRNGDGTFNVNDAKYDKEPVTLGQLTTKLLDYLLKSGGIISGNLSIQGDLEVRGTTKTSEEETLNVKDSIVVTNSSGADLSATLAGFVIRLNATDCYGIIYDASSESVKLGKGKITNGKFTFNSGEGNAIAIRADGSLMTNGHLVKWDATALKFVDAGKSVDDFVRKTTSKGLYATEADGSDVKINFSSSPTNWQIAQYDDGGRTQTNDPTDPLDAVNKQYFEAKGAMQRIVYSSDNKTISPTELALLKPGFYTIDPTYTITNGTETLPKNYYTMIKQGSTGAVPYNESTYLFQSYDGKVYTYSQYGTNGEENKSSFLQLATIDNFKTIFGQSITGSGSIIPYEAYLDWGGKNTYASFGPLDAALIPSLGANRLAFMPPNGITVEYSRDGGETWVDYPTNDEAKTALFCDVGTSYYIGGDNSTGIDKSKYMVRFTIDTVTARVYTDLRKFALYISTEGSSGCYCTVTALKASDYIAGNDTWETFVDKASIGGWSGWNILDPGPLATYSGSASQSSWQYKLVRFTFGVASHPSTSQNTGLRIISILGFGGVGWNTPSTMASKGRMYTWDYQQNVFFPQSVYANNKKLATEDQLGNYLSKTGITSQAGLTITQTSSGVQVDSAVLIDNSLLGG